MKVAWLSAGVSSFIATYLERETIDKIIYLHIEDQHEDTMRFVKDCEKLLQKKIEILQSPYLNVDNVARQFGYVNSPKMAKCTEVLKKRVRKQWERGKKDLVYVWGYDWNEKGRAESTEKSQPKQNHVFPLIDRILSKDEAHGMSRKLGLIRPKMYDIGYSNNNCKGCVKGGMGYWNKIRIDFPDVFTARAKMERDIGHTCLNGIYLDELDPTAGRIEDEILEDCGIMCEIYSQD